MDPFVKDLGSSEASLLSGAVWLWEKLFGDGDDVALRCTCSNDANEIQNNFDGKNAPSYKERTR